MKKVIVTHEIKSELDQQESFLQRSGIKIFGASSNKEILSIHTARKADLLIAEIDDKVMSGEELCLAVRKEDALKKTSIILVCRQNADIDKSLHCGANSFVLKPVNTAILLQEAHYLLHIAERRTCRVRVSTRIDGEAKGKSFTGYVENISVSGMLFRSSAVFAEGDSLVCSFNLPGSHRIKSSAEVMRVVDSEHAKRSFFYGVRFQDLDGKAFSAIEAFIRKNN